ncbi:serine/arginine repetitive matrix protein 2-like [Palaemon carinicauda]|uniref:serine/arginine repetitive matrix protein 2-like n=1 Tax=Palaemon carinicauda TaxID=392227 RepID=UPI0035B674D2
MLEKFSLLVSNPSKYNPDPMLPKSKEKKQRFPEEEKLTDVGGNNCCPTFIHQQSLEVNGVTKWEKFGRRRKKKSKRDRSPSKVTLKKEVSKDSPYAARTSSESLPRLTSPVKPPSEIAGSSGFCQLRGGGEGVASLSELGAAVKQSPVIPEVYPSDIVDAVLTVPSDVSSQTLDPAASDVAGDSPLPSAQPSKGKVGPPVSPAPSPSGEKDSGVKSLAPARAPARLRAVERRSSSSPTRQQSPRSPARQRSPGHPEKVQRLPTHQGSPTHQSSPARQRSLGRPQPEKQQIPDGHAPKGSPLPHSSIPALPVAPARPSITERLLSLAHIRPRSPTGRPSRQHAVGPAGAKERASPSYAPVTDRSARHLLRETKSFRRHLSPSHHHQRSPKRSRAHSPARSLERSPTRSYARSPTRPRAYPPAGHSPARSHSRSPAHQSPARHHAQSYGRHSPTRERSPTGRSPTRHRATSPARKTSFTSSPGRGIVPARVGHTDRKDHQQDTPPGRRSHDSPPRKRRTTPEQERLAERSRQSSFSFQEGPVVSTPKGREIPFSPAGIADTASVTRLPWFHNMINAVVQAIKPSSTDQGRDPVTGSPPLKKRKGVGFVVTPPRGKLVSRNPIKRTPSPSPTSAAPPPTLDEFICPRGIPLTRRILPWHQGEIFLRIEEGLHRRRVLLGRLCWSPTSLPEGNRRTPRLFQNLYRGFVKSQLSLGRTSTFLPKKTSWGWET